MVRLPQSRSLVCGAVQEQCRSANASCLNVRLAIEIATPALTDSDRHCRPPWVGPAGTPGSCWWARGESSSSRNVEALRSLQPNSQPSFGPLLPQTPVASANSGLRLDCDVQLCPQTLTVARHSRPNLSSSGPRSSSSSSTVASSWLFLAN